jgi:hypothetical protein
VGGVGLLALCREGLMYAIRSKRGGLRSLEMVGWGRDALDAERVGQARRVGDGSCIDMVGQK